VRYAEGGVAYVDHVYSVEEVRVVRVTDAGVETSYRAGLVFDPKTGAVKNRAIGFLNPTLRPDTDRMRRKALETRARNAAHILLGVTDCPKKIQDLDEDALLRIIELAREIKE
jgi:hypothetical protein